MARRSLVSFQLQAGISTTVFVCLLLSDSTSDTQLSGLCWEKERKKEEEEEEEMREEREERGGGKDGSTEMAAKRVYG